MLGAIVLGLIVGAIWFQLEPSLAGIQARTGLLYLMVALRPYMVVLLSVQRFSEDLRVFDRERQDHMYSVIPYQIAQFLSSLPTEIFYPLIYRFVN